MILINHLNIIDDIFKIKMKYFIINLFIFFTITFGITLQEIYDNASPMDGYEKYLILNPNEIYSGGIGIYEGNIFIEGNGAIIDLEFGVGIWVYSDGYISANLDISRCSIINGSEYALSYSGYSSGNILNCNILNSSIGIKLFDYSQVLIKNCNIINNNIFGIGIYSTTPIVALSYCNAWENGENYMENCPG